MPVPPLISSRRLPGLSSPTGPRFPSGDSPGQMGKTARDIMKHTGIDAVIEREEITYTEFEGATVAVHNDKGRHMKSYHMAKSVHDADIIMNLPRPKSHVEAAYTGAVKNFWGIIPGGEKARCHLYGKDPIAFGNVIADNYETMKKIGRRNLVIMDARTIMEGLAGPAAGPLRDTGLIIAGTDDVAVDAVMLAVGGRDAARDVPHLRACRDRGIGITDLGSIEIVGEKIESVRLKKKFGITSLWLMSIASFFTGTIIYKVVRRMPFLQKKGCTMCGDCFKICPAKAIMWEKKQYPKTDLNQCISCLCCVECCPQHTIMAKFIGRAGSVPQGAVNQPAARGLGYGRVYPSNVQRISPMYMVATQLLHGPQARHFDTCAGSVPYAVHEIGLCHERARKGHELEALPSTSSIFMRETSPPTYTRGSFTASRTLSASSRKYASRVGIVLYHDAREHATIPSLMSRSCW